MRREHKIDENQPDIVLAFQGAGCSVQSLAPVGLGCPDLLVGCRGVDFLVEVKNPDRAKGGKDYDGKTLRIQSEWRARWLGRRVEVVSTRAEALSLVARIILEQEPPAA
jgi:hypothetical protein